MPYQVLLVDDDYYFREEFCELVPDFNVIEASEGNEAINILSNPHNIDLVILDENLPGINGTDLLKKIKNISPNIKSVILTGDSSKNVAVKALRAQAADFIEKPLNREKLEKITNLILASERGEKDKSQKGTKGKIEQAKYYAERNYEKKLNLSHIANELGLSPKYLSRVFKENTGMSFSDYKLKLRINKAKGLIKDGGYNVEEISYQLGYKNPESFSKTFRNYTGLTPGEYRKKSEIPDDIGNNDENIEVKLKELKKTKKELAKAKHLAQLGKLTSYVTHEFRRPLGVIQIAAWNLKRKNTDESCVKNIEKIEKMVEEGEKLVNNLLNFSKIKMPTYQTVKIKDLLEGIIEDSKEINLNNRVEFIKELSLSEEDSMITDPLQMKEILTNIINNAYEAIPEDKSGKVRIKVNFNKTWLVIRITDNGRGILGKDLPKVCNSFFTRKNKGTGLGLSICREIIELHDGKLDIKSKYGSGTSVTIKLPRERKKI